MEQHPDQRHVLRDSLLVLARLMVADSPDEVQVRVRNLSNGGLMAEAAVKVARDTKVKVDIRNIGWVEGSVAWVHDNRFGIGFDKEIDARLARMSDGPAPGAWEPPDLVKVRQATPDPNRIRKV